MVDIAKKVCAIIGDVMIDETWYSHCKRLSPEAPVPIAELEYKHSVIGGAGNVAANLKAITDDVEVIMCSALGQNSAQLLTDQGVSIWEGSRILPKEAENVKLRIVDLHTGYHIVRVDNERYHRAHIHNLSISSLKSFFNKIKPDIIVLSDYLKGVVTEGLAENVIEYGIDYDTHVLVDSRAQQQAHFTGASIITPNLTEYHNICTSLNCSKPQDVIGSLGLRLGLLLTKSKDGLEFHTTNHDVFSSPAAGSNIIDVTGAGDTVLATVVGAMLLGCTDWTKILHVANDLAHEVCMQRGTAIPKRKLVEFQWV